MRKHTFSAFFICLLSVFLFNCSQNTPPSENNSKATPLDFIDTKLTNRNIQIEGAWNVAENIITETTNSSAEIRFSTSPRIYLSDSGSAGISWEPIAVANPVTGEQPLVNPAFKTRSTQTQNWQSWEIVQPQNSRLSYILNDPITEVKYATWVSDTSYHISIFDPLVGWGQPILIDSGWDMADKTKSDFAQFYPYIDANGNLFIAWVKSTRPQSNTFSMRRYIQGSGLTPVEQFDRTTTNRPNDSFYMLKALPGDQNSSYLFWLEGLQGINRTLWWSKHDGVNWNTPEVVTQNNVDVAQFHMNVNPSTGDLELFLQDENSRETFSKSLTNGIWQPEVPLNLSTQNIFFNAAINHRGDMIFSWHQDIAQTFQSDRLSVINVKRYLAEGGWQQTETISNVILNGRTMPYMDLNDAGNAIIAWVDNFTSPAAIYVNHFDISNGWGTQELVMQTSPDTRFQGIFDITLNNKNEALVIWEEIKQITTGQAYNVSLATHENGGSLTPIPSPVPITPIDTSGSSPSNNWTTPVLINDIQISNYSLTFTMGPVVKFTDDLNASFAISHLWKDQSSPGPLSQSMIHGGNINTNTGFLPVDFLTPPSMQAPFILDITSHEHGSSVFSFWREFANGEALSFLNTDATWSAPMDLDNGFVGGHLVPLSDNRAVYIWQDMFDKSPSANIIDPKNIGTIITDTATIEGTALIDRNIDLNANNTVTMPWVRKIVDGEEMALISYVPGLGWQLPTSVINFPITLRSHGPLTVSTGINGNIVITTRDSVRGDIYANYFNTAEQWHNWENIDATMGQTVKHIGEKLVLSNLQGNVFVIWVLEENVADLGMVQNIYASQFILSATTPASNWTTPVLVATTSGLTFSSNLKAHLDELGNIYLAWVEKIDKSSTLKYLQYDNNIGWSQQAEDIVIYDGTTSGSIVSFDLDVNSINSVLISWNQMLLQGQSSSFVTWYSIRNAL